MDVEKNEPTIFNRFPALRDKLPWVSLGVQRTPLERLSGFGHDNLWIKRDDLSSPVYGGNKVRKLEFALGDALQRKKKRVITLGGVGTNHGLATAIYSNRMGLDCSVVVFDQPITRNVKANLKLLNHFKAEIIFSRQLLNSVLEFYIRQRIGRPFSYFLDAGGSSILGTIGYVSAAFELKEQVDNGEILEPSCIFCPVGSNGTMAGLLLGCALAGLNSNIVGVRVAYPNLGPIDICSAKAVRKLAQRTYAFLKKREANLPEISIPLPTLLCDYLGTGYGHPTPEGREAYQLMASNKGIALDPCYTAKAFAAALDYCKENRESGGPLLFWNTYNSADLAYMFDTDAVPDMSPEMVSILEAAEVDF